jgi:hypothetical protein
MICQDYPNIPPCLLQHFNAKAKIKRKSAQNGVRPPFGISSTHENEVMEESSQGSSPKRVNHEYQGRLWRFHGTHEESRQRSG